MPKPDQLVKAMSRKLVSYDSEIVSKRAAGVKRKHGSGRKSKKVGTGRRAGPIGKRGDQYTLLKELYALVECDKRFARPTGETQSKSREKQLGELLVLVRRAFEEAYGDDYRSYRQRALTWSAVLHQAWVEGITVKGIRLFILDKGGIQSLYRQWKENRLESDE